MSHADDCCKYKSALEDMLDQFAYRSDDGSRRWYTTGGLSALEHGFAVMGWDDPRYVQDGGCEVAGCEKWSTCVAAYPRSLGRPDADPKMVGFGFLCGDHYRKWNGSKAEPAPADLGRIPHTAEMQGNARNIAVTTGRPFEVRQGLTRNGKGTPKMIDTRLTRERSRSVP